MTMKMYWTDVRVHRTDAEGNYASEVFKKPAQWAKFVFATENRDANGTIVSATIAWIDEDVMGSFKQEVEERTA